MNRHLNIYRPFSLNQEKQHIEDNISRALVLCLQNSQTLLHQFITKVLSPNDYDYLFNSYSQESDFFIDIQIDLKKVEASHFKAIYALALTSEDLDMNTFFKDYTYSHRKNYRPITDIFIQLNDILIIIEVKRHGEDCRQQLYNQIHQLVENSEFQKEDVKASSISWIHIMEMITKVNNFEKYIHLHHPFLKDFLGLIRQYRSNWLPVISFANLPENPQFNVQRYLRLRAAFDLNPREYNVVEKGNRLGYKFSLPWSDEVLFSIREDNSLVAAIYPGNTKGQGYSFYAQKNQEWRNIKEVNVNGITFKTSICSHLRFSGQGYITGLWFNQDEEANPICVSKNFHLSGRKKRAQWPAFEKFLDNSFKDDFDWREKCSWETKIEKSNRSQFDVSFGYEVAIIVPYSVLQSIDKTQDNLESLSEFLHALYEKFTTLLEWE